VRQALAARNKRPSKLWDLLECRLSPEWLKWLEEK
jgi:hypothetical protein